MLRNDFKRSTKTYEEYLDSFMEETSSHSPFGGYVLSYWELRHLDNFSFVTYEELSADRFKGVKKISKFLACKHSDEDLKNLNEYVSFANLRKMSEKDSPTTPGRDPRYRLVFV